MWRAYSALGLLWKAVVLTIAAALLVAYAILAATENANYLIGLVIVPAWVYWWWTERD